MEIVMQAAILIGGKGTRLGDAVAETPKPLLEVQGRPFVEHIMLNLRRFGFNEFLLLAGYRADVVRDCYGPDSEFVATLGASVKVIVEPEPLGTAGALSVAADDLQETFLLINGDSIFDFNYLDLVACGQPSDDDNWLGRVALLPVENADRYGFVDLQDGRIRAFREKPSSPQSGLINSGVYWLKSDILDRIDDLPCSLEQAVFPALAEAGLLVGRPYQGYFIDIGIPQDLQRARLELSERLQKPAAFLDRDGTLNHDDGYTHKVEGFRWMDGAVETVKLLNDRGFLVFIVTNQAGIARGFYGPDDVEALHRWMQEQLHTHGAHFDDVRYCPHHPEGSVPALAVQCECRKPATGMLTSLIERWQPDLTHSFMLGDADKDVEAATRVGIEGAKVAAGDLLDRATEMVKKFEG
ncbi:MAG: HAD-IIIA family hydrolase [Halioglobus sp.]